MSATIKAVADKGEAKIAKGVAKVAAASPSSVNALLGFVKTVILPILAPLLASLIVKYGGGKMRPYLQPVRDLLNDAYPVEEDE